MKKLLTLLFLLPIMVFGQEAFLDHSYTNPAGFKVGDTITIKFNPVINQTSPTLIQFDYQYNTKLLRKLGHTFKVNSNGSNTTAQTSESLPGSACWDCSRGGVWLWRRRRR